jgi:signal transduction histidine kinase
MNRKPVSANFKIILVLLALGIVVGLLFYTQNIVRQLQEKEHRYANLYVKALEYIGSEKASENPDLTLITEEIIYKIDFPIILADPEGTPSSSKNIKIDSTLRGAALKDFLLEQRDQMRRHNPPLALVYQDSMVTQYVYYDESDLVKHLRVLPYVEILVAALFILIGYIGFSYIKRTEQANIWVGLSKETAHQLGTPLSSLLGWIELMKSETANPVALGSYLGEMENDVQRLNRIALRFSKIGSKPELIEQDIIQTIRKSVDYLQRRIPQSGKKVTISIHSAGPVTVAYNSELFEWVLENLVKNALDAIEGNEGAIDFHLSSTSRWVTIDVSDTGKGVESRKRKDIFRPGYTTKTRGWGLGLSLSKRIVTDYHDGRLFVASSELGKGTTFRIKLPVKPVWKLFR